MNYKDEWRLLAISDNLDDVEHRPLTEEFLFYQAVATGDVEAVRKNCEQERFVSEDGVGTLSRNPITNLKYHFVITTAMITRMCGQNGMELEQAFRLSDFYIQKLDDLHTAQEVQNLHEEMVIDYTERMRREIQKDVISKHVSDCKDYIYCHVKERITVEQLASEFGISASYLSRLFKKEVGVSVSTYVKNKKIEVAKDLLKFSDFHHKVTLFNSLKKLWALRRKNIVIRIIMLNGMKRFGQKVTRLIVLLKLCNTHKHSM